MPAGHCRQWSPKNPKYGTRKRLRLWSKNVTTPTPWQPGITLQHKHLGLQLGIIIIRTKELREINKTNIHSTKHTVNHFIKEQVCTGKNITMMQAIQNLRVCAHNHLPSATAYSSGWIYIFWLISLC